jgi:2-polyprenyl-3-methyl-5-hydroxy-6-metoxy-1,4-benzoquinol methylase
MEVVNLCPICSFSKFQTDLVCKDYSVSGEFFSIMSCTNCGFKFTNPRPDENEIGRYYDSPDYISHSNTSKGIINKTYQLIRRYAIEGKVKMLEKLKPSKKTVLDIGSGTGEFLSALKESGWTTRGLEPNEKARQMAKQKYSLQIGDTAEIAEEVDHSWDVITMWHVLEHVHRLDDMIKQLKRILKDQGTLVIAVPNVTSFDANLYQKEWAAFDVPRHLYHFSKQHIQMLFEKVDMKVIKIYPMYFDSYYVSMLSEKHIKGKTSPANLTKAFINGYRSNIKGKKDISKYSSLIYIIKNA